ncbi:hypothetical protein ACOJBM_42300 [Rhizobium beringeri]
MLVVELSVATWVLAVVLGFFVALADRSGLMVVEARCCTIRLVL